MDDLHLFLAHAIQLEREAARHYEELTEQMQTAGNSEVAVFFRQMAVFSRKHLGEAMERGGFRTVLTNPRLLILDEASEGLAPLIRDEIWACLARLRSEGQSVLVIDKYVEKLIALADRHTIIERGQVVWQGGSAALDADHAIWHRYLGL